MNIRANHGGDTPVGALPTDDDNDAPGFGRSVQRTLIGVAKGALSLAIFIGVWQAVAVVFALPGYILPTPVQVATALVYGIFGGDYALALLVTLGEIIGGFVIGSLFGIIVGISLVIWPAMDRLFFPYIVAFQSLPKIAIAPLMIVWFGFGFESKVIIVAMVSAFPVLVNMIAGLKSAEQEKYELMQALCATRWQTLWYIQIPNSLPYLFAGLSSALVLSVIGAIVGEFVGARYGVGVLIMKSNFNLDVAAVFALLVLLGVVAAFINMLLRIAGSRIVFWGEIDGSNTSSM
jgi:NitT/TauT family transport system permease protein